MQKKRILILITGLALLLTAIGGASLAAAPPNQTSTVTFSTPEDTITSFFEGVAEGDFSKILQACAINEISENFHFDLNIDRLQAFLPSQSYAPTDYPLYVELNKAQIASRIASQVKILAYSLLSTQDIDYSLMTRMDVDTALSFMNEVDPSRLANLEVQEIHLSNPKHMSDTRYEENAVKIARVYGADDSTERLALFTFEQNYYMLGFTLFKYGETWKISSLSSPIANTTELGGAGKTTKEEFESMTQ
ncbi:MAG: hypothetical protein ABI690_07055 [Chloroflexota bacterium]